MNRFQKMRKVCKGYLERIPPLLIQSFQWGADWLRENLRFRGISEKKFPADTGIEYSLCHNLLSGRQRSMAVSILSGRFIGGTADGVAFEFSNGIYFCSAKYRKDATSGRFYRSLGCKTSGYDEDEKCQKVPAGSGVWFG